MTKFKKRGAVESGSSHSMEYLLNKQAAPQVSSAMVKGVSNYRKSMMENEVNSGLYTEGSSSNQENITSNAVVTASVGFKKSATSSSGSGAGFKTSGNGDTVKQSPDIYSPLWLTSNLSLPRDRATINAWCRAFYVLNPFVHNAINLHSTYPISKLQIKCHNQEVQQFFNDMIEELDLMNICVQIAQEFWLLGEAFVYAELDASKGKWSRLLIQNPDYIQMKRGIIANEPIIMLKPDENLKQIVRSNKPSDIEQRKQLSPHIIDSVRKGGNIPLDNFHVSHLARKISPYEIRGTGLPVCIFRQLALFDQLRESKTAQANNMINPLTLVKIGSADFKPTFSDIEAWRQVFEEAQYDKDFKIFTHEGVSVERVGYGSGIYDISGDISQLIKEIYVGLQVPSVLMDGGSDTTYANGGVALDVLRQRYMQFRNMLSSWLKRKIFAPISKINNFYEYRPGAGRTEKTLIVPEVDWNHMSLFDAGDYIQNLVNLTAPTPGAPEGTPNRVSLATLYRSLGLEEEDESRKLRKEAIRNEIYKKEVQALANMSLTSLRSLDDDEDISEPKEEISQTDSPVPGEMSMGNNLPGMSSPPPPPPMRK